MEWGNGSFGTVVPEMKDLQATKILQTQPNKYKPVYDPSPAKRSDLIFNTDMRTMQMGNEIEGNNALQTDPVNNLTPVYELPATNS